MSDALTDCVREEERVRLKKIDANALAYNLKQTFLLAEKQVCDLKKLGYTVEIDKFKVRIYKEMGL